MDQKRNLSSINCSWRAPNHGSIRISYNDHVILSDVRFKSMASDEYFTAEEDELETILEDYAFCVWISEDGTEWYLPINFCCITAS